MIFFWKNWNILSFGIITATKQWIHIIFVYGLADTPMMLATNIDINGKDDTYKIARLYFDRWKIEEYFKFKK